MKTSTSPFPGPARLRQHVAATLAWAMFLCAVPARGQEGATRPAEQPKKPFLQSPVVAGDRATFTVFAPYAKAVRLRSGEIDYALPHKEPFRHTEEGEWIFDPKPFTRGEQGLWTLSQTLPPGIYDYTIDVDGVVMVDPENPTVVGNTRGARGLVEIPGPAGRPRQDEWRQVPHGAVTTHWYDSKVTGSRRRMHVYTPPGYDPTGSRRYPVLYLLHGNSGHDGQWTEIGRAHVIADNLLADGKAAPMLIVMPDGHAYRPPPGAAPADRRDLKTERFEGDVFQEIMPFVERNYRVLAEREQRAIAGLSMGGGQSLCAGLRNSERFAWTGGFSASLGCALDLVPAAGEPAAAFNSRTRLFWVRIGREDFDTLVKLNRDFVERLKAAGVRHEYQETGGMHMWSVWRQYLADFMPRLFRG